MCDGSTTGCFFTSSKKVFFIKSIFNINFFLALNNLWVFLGKINERERENENLSMNVLVVYIIKIFVLCVDVKVIKKNVVSESEGKIKQ